jgi:hypothetical protein
LDGVADKALFVLRATEGELGKKMVGEGGGYGVLARVLQERAGLGSGGASA